MKKINKKRNELEHDFKKPTHEEVVDFLDIASLFFQSTKQFLQRTYQFEIIPKANSKYYPWVCLRILADKGLIKLSYATEKMTKYNIEISVDDEENYNKFLTNITLFITNR